MKFIILLTLGGLCGCGGAIPLVFIQPNNPTPYGHSAVVANAAIEEMLPQELKNHFYDNPRTASVLAMESWLANKEMMVIHRDADEIPRQKIFDVLHSAGLARK